MTIEKLLDAIKENKVIFGTSETLKKIKVNAVEAVYLASNCPETFRAKIKQLAESNKISVIELKENNEELAVLCKKPFSISVVSIKRSKDKE